MVLMVLSLFPLGIHGPWRVFRQIGIEFIQQCLLVIARKLTMEKLLNGLVVEAFPACFFSTWVNGVKQAIVSNRRFKISRSITNHQYFVFIVFCGIAQSFFFIARFLTTNFSNMLINSVLPPFCFKRFIWCSRNNKHVTFGRQLI